MESMELEVMVDMSEAVIQSYKMFSKDTYQRCETLISHVRRMFLVAVKKI